MQTGQRSKVFAPIGVREDAGIRMMPFDYSTVLNFLIWLIPPAAWHEEEKHRQMAQGMCSIYFLLSFVAML